MFSYKLTLRATSIPLQKHRSTCLEPWLGCSMGTASCNIKKIRIGERSEVCCSIITQSFSYLQLKLVRRRKQLKNISARKKSEIKHLFEECSSTNFCCQFRVNSLVEQYGTDSFLYNFESLTALQLIRQHSSMEIQKGISSNLLNSSQNPPLTDYFRFRQQMMSQLEPEQKTSEYITKLWNQLLQEAKRVANAPCESFLSSPESWSDQNNFQEKMPQNSAEITTIFKQAGECETKIQQKTLPYIQESSTSSQNPSSKQKNIKKIPRRTLSRKLSIKTRS